MWPLVPLIGVSRCAAGRGALVFWILLVVSSSDVRWVGAGGVPRAGLII